MMLHRKKHWSQRDDRDAAKNRIINKWRGKAWWRDYKRERRLFGRWLCKEAEKGDREWSPMRYVSQQEIDEWREWKGIDNESNFYDKFPHITIIDRSYDWKWTTVWEPDYYRVEHRSKPSDKWEQYNTGGFPEHHANGVVKDFEKYALPEFIDSFLEHFVDKELRLMEQEKKELEDWQKTMLKKQTQQEQEWRKRWKARERYSRTRGITPDVETTAFFQALATGACVNEKL